MASYEQNKSSKLWSARFRDSSGHQRRLSGFKTKREAQEAYNEYKAKEGEIATGASTTVDELVALYLVYISDRTKESSQKDIRSRLLNHIVPHLGSKRVNDLDPYDVLRWQQSLTAFSFTYRKILRSQLNAVLRYGEKYHNLRNIMPKVDTLRDPERIQKEMQVWTPDEFKLFIAALEEFSPGLWPLFFRLLYITGARRGELMALQIGDLDVASCSVHIRASVTTKGSEAWKLTTPKNSYSIRKVRLPEGIMAELIVWANNHGGPFVFGGGRPVPTTTMDRTFTRATKEAGVPRIRIHDLRHSCASYLISEGVDIVTISKRLGHKDIEQTLNTYAHCFKQGVDKSVEAFEKCAL
jgi:integrase